MAKTPTQIRSLARGHTETAINVLVGIMNKETAPEASRVAAANAILDRGWGKPSQPLIGGDDDENPIRAISRIERIIVPAKRNEDEDNGGTE